MLISRLRHPSNLQPSVPEHSGINPCLCCVMNRQTLEKGELCYGFATQADCVTSHVGIQYIMRALNFKASVHAAVRATPVCSLQDKLSH